MQAYAAESSRRGLFFCHILFRPLLPRLSFPVFQSRASNSLSFFFASSLRFLGTSTSTVTY